MNESSRQSAAARRVGTPALVCGIVAACCAVPATAQTRGAATNPLGLWQVDAMLDTACGNLTKRYNLSPGQEEYTRALMTRRLKAFLRDHESELRGLMGQWLQAQVSGGADPAFAERWAQKAQPIFDAAEKTILEGNQAWRDVLNEKQQVIHDADLRQMDVTFKQVRQRLSRWEEGGFDENRDLFAPQSTPVAHRPASRSGRARAVKPRVGPAYQPNTEDYWDATVKRFITQYRLDNSQQQSALAILTDCKDRAVEYRRLHADETEQIRQRLREFGTADADPKKRVEAYRELTELSRPVTDIYRELQARLQTIPTNAQKAAREQDMKKRRQAFQQRRNKQANPAAPTVRTINRRPATAPATRPAPKP